MGCDLRATVHGHKRPDIVLDNPICFIHTEAAIFAIDEDGVCCYVTSLTGTVPRNANRCRGAEYVACLDLSSEEGLVADPRVGATGLFVGRGASQKMALLRTGPITRVEFVEDMVDADPAVDEADRSGPVRREDEVSQIKPVDEIQRRVDAQLAELEAIELEPFEVLPVETDDVAPPVDITPHASVALAPPPPPSRGPVTSMLAAPTNVTPFTLKAPTPPPRRSSLPSAPPLMAPADLLAAALEAPAPPSARAPSTSEIDVGWGGEDPRKTRLGMPVVKLS